MGQKNADEMLFWTKEEFAAFIEAVKDKPASYAIFMTLYYTGIQEGELLALTPADIDLSKSILRINKSYQRLGGKDIVTTPKTPKSKRVISIPEKLCDCLRVYMGQCYGLRDNDRLFPYTKYFLSHEMDRGCKHSGVKRIKVHSLRHPNVKLRTQTFSSFLKFFKAVFYTSAGM